MTAQFSPRSQPLIADMLEHRDAPTRTISPNGGSVAARTELSQRFANRLSRNHRYTRKAQSYQGNRDVPGFRWMKCKEGFPREFVTNIICSESALSVFDPFAGLGTTPLVAAGLGLEAMGIEVMPVGIAAAYAISSFSRGVSMDISERKASELVHYIDSKEKVQEAHMFPHVRITEKAFSEKTEGDLARALAYIASIKNTRHRELLDFACMSVLEDISFTRKDGQFLRWDSRSKRTLRSSVDKGHIPEFSEALSLRFRQMCEDAETLRRLYGACRPTLAHGSCLSLLRDIPSESFSLVVTSPPYVNRYDYTRTYALELAWLGLGSEGIVGLRQAMLSTTVENKSKADWQKETYHEPNCTISRILDMRSQQGALQEVLSTLRKCENELSNKGIIRMLDQYFLEMAIIVKELGRIVRPWGSGVHGKRQRSVSWRGSSGRLHSVRFC